MKKIINLTIVVVAAATISSCGSISSLVSKKRTVHLMQAPSDLEVIVNGEKQNVTSEVFASYENTTWYTSAVKLPFKKPVTMELRSGSKNATFELKPKGSRAIFWGNVFSFPVIGHIFDAVTKNSKRLYPYYIDVEYALQGKPIAEWRGKGKLKRMEKRGAR
jgi:hypothetical protein